MDSEALSNATMCGGDTEQMAGLGTGVVVFRGRGEDGNLKRRKVLLLAKYQMPLTKEASQLLC